MSPRPAKSERLVYEGSHFHAEWYYMENGEMPAYRYYLSLSKEDRLRFMLIVKHFCDRSRGDFLPTTMYNQEDPENKIYAFKPNAHRFFNFMMAGSKVIITNAYQKNSQKMSKIGRAQCQIAIGYRQDYIQRVARGTYYG